MMKINNKIFNLPPYISTSWSNISALYIKEENLVVHLADGAVINIPNLSIDLLDLIFSMHGAYLEDAGKQISQRGILPRGLLPSGIGEMELPFKIGIGAVDGLGTVLQHNPAQANMPPLPNEILDKIQSIAKIIAPDDLTLVPRPEPHCNCMHCQIARTINQGLQITDIYQKNEQIPDAIAEKNREEIVKDEELGFQQWEIKQLNDPKMYSVVNKLDPLECYNVYLGQPVGCTCGKRAVNTLLQF